MEMVQGTLPVGSVDDLYQEDNPLALVVPVKHQGPIQIHNLPARSGGSRTWTGITSATRIGNDDPRRKRAVVLISSATATDYAIVGATQNEVDSNYGFRLPINVPLEITNQEAIYAKVSSATAVLSILNEVWAD